MTPIGRLLKFARAVRVYKDGDGHGFVWRWWNPLAGVSAPLLILWAILVQGMPETIRYRHYVGIGVNPWFVEHPEQLEWLP